MEWDLKKHKDFLESIKVEQDGWFAKQKKELAEITSRMYKKQIKICKQETH